MSKRNRDLPIPAPALDDDNSLELARVWMVDGTQVVSLRVGAPDPEAWGYALADLARHVAAAYAQKGVDARDTLRGIRNAFLDDMVERAATSLHAPARAATPIGKTPKPRRAIDRAIDRATSRASTKLR